MDNSKEILNTTDEQAILTAKRISLSIASKAETEASEVEIADGETPLDKNVRLMSPGRMVARRFFRSKLSIIGLVLIVALLIFSWFGPVICDWCGYGSTWFDESDMEKDLTYETVTDDDTPAYTYDKQLVEFIDENGNTVIFYQVVETKQQQNILGAPGIDHILGTDKSGMDIFVRLMYGGRISLTISFIAVFATTILGIIFGGLAGYFGKWVDNIIMRICDILMCLPTLPLLLILGTILDAFDIPGEYRIYLLMLFLTIFSWSGTARLVRGQILSLREQEYMVAAEAMGYSTSRKIFKHLIPNVLPQLIVTMTLSLGSMILYESSLSYLGMGVRAPYAAWGTMINIISEDANILQNYFNVWGPPGFCIVLAVLGFNFVGDGLRDALDPKMRR